MARPFKGEINLVTETDKACEENPLHGLVLS